MAHFEREYWQAHISFSGGGASSLGPREIARFLDALEGVALPDMQWQMPAFTQGGPSLLELNIGGVIQNMMPDFVSGTSPTGWQIRLSAQQLLVRHQELVLDGARGLARTDFPDQQFFLAIANSIYSLLPAGLVARRASMSVNYAMFTGEIYAPSVVNEIMRRGTRCAAPPPDGVSFNLASSELEFQTISGRRYAVSDVTRLGNWFDPTGRLLANSAVVRTAEIKTASPEPPYPVATPLSVDALPELTPADVQAVIGRDGPAGLAMLLERLRASLPEGLEIHE